MSVVARILWRTIIPLLVLAVVAQGDLSNAADDSTPVNVQPSPPPVQADTPQLVRSEHNEMGSYLNKFPCLHSILKVSVRIWG